MSNGTYERINKFSDTLPLTDGFEGKVISAFLFTDFAFTLIFQILLLLKTTKHRSDIQSPEGMLAKRRNLSVIV